MATQGSNSSTSRLAQMQLRYQQKQQQERELKRAELIGNRTIDDIIDGKKLAGPLGTGKVRQMFDERRQGQRTIIGIDKSYPLQPIAPPSRASSNTSETTVTTKTTTKTTWRSEGGGGGNIDINELDTDRINGNYILSNKLEEGDFLDNEQFPESFNQSLDDDDNYINNNIINNNKIATKLPNVGRQMAGLNLNGGVSINNNSNNNNSPLNGIKLKPVITKKSGPVKSSIDTTKKVPTRTKLAPAGNNRSSTSPSTPTSNASRPSSNKSTSTTINDKSNPSSAKNSATVTRTQTVKMTTPTIVKRTPANPPENSVECGICGRYFNQDRIATHEVICKKTATKKRKIFDVTKHRIKGTDAEQFIRKSGIKLTAKKPIQAAAATTGTAAPKKSDWRRKHEEFIQAIRSAKELQAHLARGGKVSDIPPPPPSENPDYVQCPHCARRFNEGAAQRHIPKCANFQHNKPKPGPSKSVLGSKKK